MHAGLNCIKDSLKLYNWMVINGDLNATVGVGNNSRSIDYSAI